MEQILFLLALALAALAYWFGATTMQQKRRADETAQVVGGDYGQYLLEVLANAANIDARVEEAERAAIVRVMSEAGAPVARDKVDDALAKARLSKEQLLAYLRERSGAFTEEQKLTLLRGVLAVANADGQFVQREQEIYQRYIEAVGVRRQSAPVTVQSLLEGSVNQRNL